MQFPPLPDWFWYPITFLYGAIVGSFLNVVIYRLPLGKSINGSSACPNCNTYLRVWDNIPILGFLMLGGRCRYCRTPISWRYMSVELVNACLWVALYDRISGTTMISWVDFVFQALFASVLVAMVFIDLDHFIAPDELNILGFVLATARDIACLVLAWQAGTYVWEENWPRYAYFHYLPRALPGGLVYGGVLFAVSVLGFVYYAREPGESVGATLRRYFDFSDAEPEADALPQDALLEEESEESFDEEDEDLDDEEPPRLRFSPGFLAILSAGFLATVVGAWGVLALVVPALSFVVLARRPGEDAITTFRRFFRSDEDDNYARGEADPDQLAAEAEAAEFAKEAETGAHGGMGLGDVKLALAIGAMLGPVLSIVSLLVATFFGAGTGIAINVRRRRRSLRYGVPFVPFMAAGAIVTMLYGTAFVNWYAGLLTPPDTTHPLTPPAARRPLRPARSQTPLRGVDPAALPPPGRG